MPPLLIGIGIAASVGAGIAGAVGAGNQDQQNQERLNREQEAAGIQNKLLDEQYTVNKQKLDNQIASLTGAKGSIEAQKANTAKIKGREANKLSSLVAAGGFAMEGSMREELNFQNSQFDLKLGQYDLQLGDVSRAIEEGTAAQGLLGKELQANKDLSKINDAQREADRRASRTNAELNAWGSVLGGVGGGLQIAQGAGLLDL